MSADLERLLADAAATPRTSVDPGEIVAAARRRRGRRRGGAAVLALLLVVAAGLTVPRLAGELTGFASGGPLAVLPLPPEGEVAPEFLPDGTPVFVVHEDDRAVHVVRAVASYGVADLGVAWCPPGGRFLSEWNGSVFGPDGGYAGGPEPAGLVTYDIEVAGGQVRVLRARTPVPRDSDWATFPSGASECWGRESLDRSVVVDHGWLSRSDVLTPEEALRRASEDHVLVRGVLVEYPDGHAALCAELARTQPAGCPEGALELERRRPDTGTWAMEVLARGVVRDGRFTDVLLPVVFSAVDVHDSAAPDVPPGYGEGPITIVEDVITVPAVDLAFGAAPDLPVVPGDYEVRLRNGGAIVHTLVVDLPDGRWRMEAPAGTERSARIQLPAGDHVLYCDIPGHREAGMEFTLRVRG